MTLVPAQQQFLDHLARSHRPEVQAAVCAKQFETIRREMQRTGSWRADASFLDLGCGIGIHTEYWSSRGLRATGVDSHDAQIAVARARAEAARASIRYEKADAGRLPFDDDAFQIVFANSILEHVSDWQACLSEWVRVLAPGGLLWVETTNVLCPRQQEYRWLPLYSWWPAPLKAGVVCLARRYPVLANYSPCPALHWFSFFGLRRFLGERGLLVRDRFDCMDPTGAGPAKRLVRALALSSLAGRLFAYLLVSPLVLLATKPRRVKEADAHGA